MEESKRIERPLDEGWRKARVETFDATAFAQSLKSLVFFIGGSHVAALVEEAEQAAWKGMVVKYE